MQEDIIHSIRQSLKEKGKSEIPKSSSRFFKKGEEALVYGLKNEVPHSIAKAYLPQIKKLPKQIVFEICESLWQSHYLEESLIACTFSIAQKKKFEPEDFAFLERIVNQYVNNWASCDTFCNHTVGTFLMMYPAFVPKMKEWAISKNRWTKRAAAVSLIVPARKGLFLTEIIDIADLLLLDADDMVQKGYGWMLKTASESNQDTIYNYVISKKDIMPRTALRYAIEKMPKDLKVMAMKK